MASLVPCPSHVLVIHCRVDMRRTERGAGMKGAAWHDVAGRVGLKVDGGGGVGPPSGAERQGVYERGNCSSRSRNNVQWLW